MRLFIEGAEVDLRTTSFIIVFDDDEERISKGCQIIGSFQLKPGHIRLFGTFPKERNPEACAKEMDDVHDACIATPFTKELDDDKPE